MSREEIQERVDEVHNLAVRLYLMMGYRHDKSKHKPLYDSQHPTEQMVWEMEVEAYRDIDGLDGDEYLDELRSYDE